MDYILERHLKRVLTQNTSINNPQKINKDVNPDPILGKHLSKIFKENDTISEEFKNLAEIKKKNEKVLEAFSSLIEHKLKEPIPDIKEEPIIETPEIVQEEPIIEEEPVVIEELDEILPSEEDVVEESPELSVIDSYRKAPKNIHSGQEFKLQTAPEPEVKTAENIYVKTIKDSESTVPEIKDDDNAFFKFLDKHKDDARVKNFFNYHSETMKKELYSINEKYSKAHKLWLSESGGGGGGYNNSNNSLTKLVKTIGNGVDTVYTISHGFDTKDLVISVYDNQNDEVVLCSFKNINNNETEFVFDTPIEADSIRVVIIA
jgi:hypothetical protein